MQETMHLGLRLGAYGLGIVFAALVGFAVLVKALLRWLPAPEDEHKPN